MKYIGEFKNINDELLKIEIVTNNDTSSTTELLLADNPFSTSLEGGNIIYKPCKYSSATVRLLLSQPLFDLYSSIAKNVKVTLLKNNAIQWVGYVEPNIYSQSYETDYDLMEIECIDGLAVLEYISYQTIVNDSPQIHNLFSVIRNIVKQSDCYRNIYIPKSYNTDITKFEIAEQNFFDEDNNAMTCKEVLEQIAQYLGFTCIADKDNVIFIDYDAIKADINDYYVINVDDTSISTTSISSAKTIDRYSENGQQISLDNVYNKVVIKDDLYAVDSVIPDIFNDDTLTNVTKGDYIEVRDEIREQRDKYRLYTQYFTSSNCKSYYYDVEFNTDFPNQFKGETWENDWSGDKLTLYDTSNIGELDYGFIQSKVGATLIKRQQINTTDNPDEPNKLDLENILLITPNDALSKQDKVLFSIPLNLKQIFSKGFHFIINFDCAIGRYIDTLYIDEHPNEGSGNWELDYSQLYIRAQLYFNGKYWDGGNYGGMSEGEWTTTPATFKIFLKADSNKDFINKSFPVTNTIKWNQFLQGEGFDIPIPDGKLNGLGEFRIISIDRRLSVDNEFTKGTFIKEENGDEGTSSDVFSSRGVEQAVYFIKNFTLDLVTENNEYISNDDSNTEYSNVINDDYVKELSDITFKICTWDNKQPNYSCVIYSDGTTSNYLDTTVHRVFNKQLRQEEHLIERIVNQYSTPSVIFDFSLYNEYLPYSKVSYMNKIFIIDGCTTNWYDNTSSIKLIEKK